MTKDELEILKREVSDALGYIGETSTGRKHVSIIIDHLNSRGFIVGDAEQLRKERDELAADRYKLADALVFLQSTMKFNHPVMELAKKVTENGNA